MTLHAIAIAGSCSSNGCDRIERILLFTSLFEQMTKHSDLLPGLLEDKNLFQQWLAQQPAETVVGETCSGYNCPIAKYLNQHGVEKVDVASDCIIYPDPDRLEYVLPEWVKEFIAQCDAIDSRNIVPVTASEAIAILESETLMNVYSAT
jgi:hypothetical protein